MKKLNPTFEIKLDSDGLYAIFETVTNKPLGIFPIGCHVFRTYKEAMEFVKRNKLNLKKEAK